MLPNNKDLELENFNKELIEDLLQDENQKE
jgi:hypothetical protein